MAKRNLMIPKFLLFILLTVLHEPILSADVTVYPKIIENNTKNKGEFQLYVSGMNEISKMTLENGNEVINVNFDKITISNCGIFEFETECVRSLIGCQWSSDKCSPVTKCEQLTQYTCERVTSDLKNKCQWDSRNDICILKAIEIKSCAQITLQSDCTSSLFGCQWSANKCSSATQCAQLSPITCEKTINSLRDICILNKESNSCQNKKLCNEFNNSTACLNNNLGCQWYYGKCIDYFSCNDFGFPSCINTPGKFKDKCEWYTRDSSYRVCISQKTSALNCNENVNELDCGRSLLGCYWYKDECINAEQCNELIDFGTCLNNTGILKDKCEWFTRDSSYRACRGKQNLAEKCVDILNADDCSRSILGCRWYKDECINVDQCNELIHLSTCLNNTGILKDKCEWFTRDSSYRACKGNVNLAEKCVDILNEDDCSRSILGCRWYKDICINAEQCDQLIYFSICLNNTGILKDKCEWFTRSSSYRACRAKSVTSHTDNCNAISNDECQKGINGCYWISGKCILPKQCSDFDQTTCENIKSYSSFRGTCEWNEDSKKCQRRAGLYGVCNDNINENDCSRSLLGCIWTNNKCIDSPKCSLLSYSVCKNLLSNSVLRDTCEWNENTKKCQRKPNLYGFCSDNLDENDCIRSQLGCAWTNNKCIYSTQCYLLSSSVCENLLSNSLLQSTCEWNKSTKKCQRKANLYDKCGDNLNENDCSRSSLGCAWINNACVNAHYCYLLSSSVCENLLSNTLLQGTCEWNKSTKKCLKKANLYGLCNDNNNEEDCNRSNLGCFWTNNRCETANSCNLLSSTACENVLSNTILRGACKWNINDKICLSKSGRLLRNLVNDEVTTKYKCSFNYPTIDENKNFNLTLVDKNNNKVSIPLSLIASASNSETTDDNNFVIYRSSCSYLKSNLLSSLIFILFLFMFKN